METAVWKEIETILKENERMAANWRTIRIFISSTFKDMYAKLEELVK
ncbi:MAG: hypothetical protein WC476_13040 [Phycisphaerae bacterium]